MRKALSLAQAILIKKDFEYLTGMPYSHDGDPWRSIEVVAIAPWDDINKSIFLEYYKIKGDPVAALRFYQNLSFDVIVISMGKNRAYVFKSLETYCSEHGIGFNVKHYLTPYHPAKMHN